MSMRSYTRVGLAIVACYGAGALGALFTDASVGSWYSSLEKPAYNPPAWLFAPVWLVLYGLMAAALVRVWDQDHHGEQMEGWVPLFFVHLVANAAWPIFFFGFHAILLAFIDILILAVAVLMLLTGAWGADRRAGYLLVPYFLWVCFALVLNLSIWWMN